MELINGDGGATCLGNIVLAFGLILVHPLHGVSGFSLADRECEDR